MTDRRIITCLGAVVLLLTSGCTCLRLTNSQKTIPVACFATCDDLGIAPTHYLLTVDIARQTVSLFETNRFVKAFRCSTSRFGIGEVLNSDRTPLGLHRISEKIGAGEPPGTIFQDREVIGTVSELGVAAGAITTRIMWLDGLEPGYNRGGEVDTHDRLIYIHGTGNQHSIGRPATNGCIHLADLDLIYLFDLLPSGTLIWIAER
jgi:hypothetical protein